MCNLTQLPQCNVKPGSWRDHPAFYVYAGIYLGHFGSCQLSTRLVACCLFQAQIGKAYMTCDRLIAA